MGLSVMSEVYRAACERRSAVCTGISRQPCTAMEMIVLDLVSKKNGVW